MKSEPSINNKTYTSVVGRKYVKLSKQTAKIIKNIHNKHK